MGNCLKLMELHLEGLTAGSIMGKGHGHEAKQFYRRDRDVSLIVSVLGFASSTGATMKRH